MQQHYTDIRRKLISFLILQFFFTIPALSQAVWKQYNGPFAGEVNSFALHGDSLFASSRLTGIFKSADGIHWTAVIPELTVVHSLLDNDTSLLIGTNALYSYNQSHGLSQLGQTVMGAIDHIHRSNGNIFVSTDYGIYKYDRVSNQLVLKTNGIPDQGESLYWTRDLTGIGNVLFCNSLGSGVYRSIDAGENWELLNVAANANWLNFLTLQGTAIFCGGNNGNIYVSTDQGNSWIDIQHDLPGTTLYKLAVHNYAIFLSTYDGTYKLNGGETHWNKVTDKIFSTLAVHNDTLFVSDEAAVFRWNNSNNSFVRSNNGINTSRVNEIALFDQKVYSATERGVHFTSTNGDEWSVVPELETSYIRAIEAKDTKLFAGTWKGLYVTSQGSTSWNICSNGISNAAVWDIEVNENNIYVATDDGLYVSRNNGNSWKLLGNSMSPYGQILYIAVNDTMLVTGNNAGLYKILPDSTNWKNIEFIHENEIASLNIVDNDLYASSINTSIYKSSDYGETWDLVTIPTMGRIDMVKRGDNIYAADYRTIFSSPDDGATWNFWSETGISDIIITCITEGDSAFYAGTYGKSIWRRAFLSSNNISSDIYAIDNSTIYNVTDNTTLQDFRANVTLSYGSSLKVNKNTSSSGREAADVIQQGDEINIIAEDSKNVRVLQVARNNSVTATETTKQKESAIYPIPSKDILYINTIEKVNTCYISNNQGKRIAEPSIRNNSIDIGSLPKGFYFLTIQTNTHKKEVLKFIKE